MGYSLINQEGGLSLPINMPAPGVLFIGLKVPGAGQPARFTA